MASNQNQKKKKRSLGLGWLIFLVFIALTNLAEDLNFERIRRYFRLWEWRIKTGNVRLDETVLAPIVAAVLIFVVTFVLVKTIRRKKEEAEKDKPTMARTSAAVQRRDPRTKSFTGPDAYCVVCDHMDEDHFRRDKQTRIRQLDDWLKNGLIDREEYRVLKARFEQNL